jgi:hypothetical protein
VIRNSANRAYELGVAEFVEIDPNSWEHAFDAGEDAQSRQQLLDEFAVDKDRLRALMETPCSHAIRSGAAQLIPFTVGV